MMAASNPNAYLDESGAHEGASVCLVAGYFGGPGQWKKFSQEDLPALHSNCIVLLFGDEVCVAI
jgi:hypothetical protein